LPRYVKRRCTHSAENAGRAAAMVRTRTEVRDMPEEFALTEHRVRQEAITAELIELAFAT